MERTLNRVIHFLFIALLCLAVVLCLICAYRQLNTESCLTLTVFNLFFISIFFRLNGSLTKKAAILTCGNLLGLMWNYLFQTVSNMGLHIFGESFIVFFNIIYPILTLTWIIPFWSLSLSIMPKPPVELST